MAKPLKNQVFIVTVATNMNQALAKKYIRLALESNTNPAAVLTVKRVMVDRIER